MIGYRGSGKTTVGRIVAGLLHREFADLDEWIENRTGKEIAQIFNETGEPGFRQIETISLMDLTARTELVVALGGGCCETSENRQAIVLTGKVVWLRSPPQILWQRIQADPATPGTRPALTNLSSLNEINLLLSRRESNYAACADYTLDSSASNPNELAVKIASWWQTVDKSNRG